MPRIFDQSARPVIFGELLFDQYPDGNKILAGAPLTVAWHLQGFGLRPILITRIGQDAEGELALAAMHQWGMDTRAVQIDHKYPTGHVQITQNNNDNQFEIQPDQAWDFISSALAMEWVNTLPCSLIYTGSLAQRNPVSHKTLQRLMLETHLPVFVDINIREPWAELNIIEQCLDIAHWLKLSDSELQIILKSDLSTNIAKQLAIKRFKLRHNINTVHLTRGDQGSVLINESKYIEQTIDEPISLVDSVGAGDAYAAVCILGLHNGWDEEKVLKRANQFAKRICQQQGATSLMQSDYTALMKQWT